MQNIITNNANNNKTMHAKFLNMLRELKFDVKCFEKIFCLIHVIQLTLKELFDVIHIESKNDNFQIK